MPLDKMCLIQEEGKAILQHCSFHFQSSEPITRAVLLNMLGNTVKTWMYPTSVLNLSDLPDGLYTMKFTDKTQREMVKKIIKIR